ncbi:hypothetical protein CE456_12680 [Aeromonas salmonicida]|nr:hypothetical protein CE456_12680 [Aeromonas salmonicida]ASI27707.1 hypothetical protein CE463_12705 [Aeromonas salmonicida]ASI31838.1 hypothetical protein CE462_11655 [Aeromonas salmonicida]TNI09739.1 hypothetical protein CF103_21440 [Aeromonas salmonicida]TNI33747.1 hypothetical protein CF110_19585 [Aeromonas salmonicida]
MQPQTQNRRWLLGLRLQARPLFPQPANNHSHAEAQCSHSYNASRHRSIVSRPRSDSCCDSGRHITISGISRSGKQGHNSHSRNGGFFHASGKQFIDFFHDKAPSIINDGLICEQ